MMVHLEIHLPTRMEGHKATRGSSAVSRSGLCSSLFFHVHFHVRAGPFASQEALFKKKSFNNPFSKALKK